MREHRASPSPEALNRTINFLTRLAWWFRPFHKIPLYFADLLRARL